MPSLRTKTVAWLQLSGEKELAAKLAALSSRDASRITRRAMLAGAKEMRDEIRWQIKPAKTPGHSARGLKASIGARVKKSRRTGDVEAKAGVGVGGGKGGGNMKGKAKNQAPHFHLVALGTRDRWTGHRTRRTKTGEHRERTGNPIAYRGRMPADDFVGRAYQARGSKAVETVVGLLRSGIEEAARKSG